MHCGGTPLAQRYRTWTKEYRLSVPTSSSAVSTIWLPTAAHYFRVGCMTVLPPNTNSVVTMYVERGRSGAPFQQSQ